MTDPSRWKQIEELYHAALECDPGDREELLARADPDLRREVESLLAQESGGTPIAHPAWEGAASLLGSTVVALTPGTLLGPYKIEGPLGAGGMGEVFRGVDTRLGRSVAVKTSREQFSERFNREARAISSLNHPHVCTLYDVGPNYLVMELCEGETLAARLNRGKLTIQEALRYGAQIADALAAAHAKGITHRDLKPGNIMLTKAGVKVLDFGLAKSPQDETLTGTRMVMGTPAYMAPEQREGKECDARTDIYALGLVLYEMATGKRAEQGQIPSLYTVSPQLAHVIERCLAQDPDHRWQSARDVAIELEWAAASKPLLEGRLGPGGARRLWLAGSVAVMLVVTAVFALWALRRTPSAATETVQFQIQAPERPNVTAYLQVSPNGRHMVFSGLAPDGHERLWLRSLDSLDARVLPGSDGAANPFWSADSRFVAFRAEGKLKKVPIAGGPPQIICDLPEETVGGAWNQDGVIIVGSATAGIWRIPPSGGPRSELTMVDLSRQETHHGRPVFLPDGKHFLYLRISGNQETRGIYLGSLDVKPEQQSRQRLLPGRLGAGYAPASDPALGYILFLQDDTLMAQVFDNRRLLVVGEPVPVAEHVGSNRVSTNYFSVSGNGALIYRKVIEAKRQLRWLDRKGKILGTLGDAGNYRELALSPNGARVVLGRYDTANSDLWTMDSIRGTSTRLTFNPGGNVWAIWSPGGDEVFFAFNRGESAMDLYRKKADGTGRETLVLRLPRGYGLFPNDVSSDGKYLLYTGPTQGSDDIFMLALDGKSKPAPFVATPADESHAKFSLDGRWVVYQSNESGRTEIYVRPFPPTTGGGDKWMISNGGGIQPRWRRDGKEIFYMGANGALMAVEVSTNPAFRAGTLKVMSPNLTPLATVLIPAGWTWDVSSDGQRFLINKADEMEDPRTSAIDVVLNWTGLLKRP